jgi:hypothetical protein
LNQFFKDRQKDDNEFWLIDVSALMKTKRKEEKFAKLQNLKVDLDDNVFFYFYENDSFNTISILEVYKIDYNYNLIILQFGNWSDQTGLNLISNEPKWVRRNDLKVTSFTYLVLLVDLLYRCPIHDIKFRGAC